MPQGDQSPQVAPAWDEVKRLARKLVDSYSDRRRPLDVRVKTVSQRVTPLTYASFFSKAKPITISEWKDTFYYFVWQRYHLWVEGKPIKANIHALMRQVVRSAYGDCQGPPKSGQ